MNENVVTTIISASAGIISTALVGFFTATVLCGQWWVTPKHKAKALCKLHES